MKSSRWTSSSGCAARRAPTFKLNSRGRAWRGFVANHPARDLLWKDAGTGAGSLQAVTKRPGVSARSVSICKDTFARHSEVRRGDSEREKFRDRIKSWPCNF